MITTRLRCPKCNVLLDCEPIVIKEDSLNILTLIRVIVLSIAFIYMFIKIAVVLC